MCISNFVSTFVMFNAFLFSSVALLCKDMYGYDCKKQTTTDAT